MAALFLKSVAEQCTEYNNTSSKRCLHV